MTPRTRSSLLWGAVGALAFLVLVQGYRLVVGSLGLDVGSALGVAVAVGVVVGAASYATEKRIAAKGRT